MSDEAEFGRWARERQVALLRTAVLLTGDRHRAEDLTERDAAAVLGVSVGTVKSQTHLALRRLREAAPELASLLEEDAR
jgi:DNA-directed RNA polymerase specialized sigma24 family protein